MRYKFTAERISSSDPNLESQMFDPSNPIDQWAFHACDAKQVANQVFYQEQVYDGESAIMLDWLLYHDVLSKISFRYWKPRTSGQAECVNNELIRNRALLLPRRSKVLLSAITALSKLTFNRL